MSRSRRNQCNWCRKHRKTVVVRGATTDLSDIDVCDVCLPEVLDEISEAHVLESQRNPPDEITWYRDNDTDEYVYTDGISKVRIYAGDLLQVAFTLQDGWTGGQDSATYSMASSADFSPENIRDVLTDLESTFLKVQDELDEEDDMNVVQALETLEALDVKLSKAFPELY